MIALTPAEDRVARLYATGYGQSMIAQRIGSTPAVVDKQLTRATRKLGVVRDRRAIAIALQSSTVGWRRGRAPGVTADGMRRGDPMRIVGGLYVGREATFWGRLNHRQVQVQIGGGRIAVLRKNVERVAA